MGDVSIIARRLEGGTRVQYGWSGNGGYYRSVGNRLLCYYDEPELVEYLFSLGQMRYIGKPYSEKGGESIFYTNEMSGEPHYLGKSEREIFSRIAFVDYGYFYDLDNEWYYIIPGPFRIKIKMGYIHYHLDDRGYEFAELINIQKKAAEYILNNYYSDDVDFQSIIKEKYPDGIDGIRKDIMDADNPCYRIWEKYRSIYDYLDDWIVIEVDKDEQNITGVKIHKNQDDADERVETIDW